jgi:hypothetical protein
MEEEMKEALKEYSWMVRRKGYVAATPLLLKYQDRFKDFDKWAMAIRMMFRIEELLDEREKSREG